MLPPLIPVWPVDIECPVCDGHGVTKFLPRTRRRIRRHVCPLCRGSGMVFPATFERFGEIRRYALSVIGLIRDGRDVEAAAVERVAARLATASISGEVSRDDAATPNAMSNLA